MVFELSKKRCEIDWPEGIVKNLRWDSSEFIVVFFLVSIVKMIGVNSQL